MIDRAVERTGKNSAGQELLRVDRRIMADRDTRLQNEALAERVGLPDDERLIAPSVFVGSHALVGTAITDQALAELLSLYADGTGEPTPLSPGELEAARHRVDERFRRTGMVTVLLGGLVDGVNPCAFVTLIFLISYLGATGRRGRDILLVGTAFAAAVFCAYFAMGVGLAAVLEQLEALPTVSLVVTWGIIGLTFVLAALSAWDSVQAWRGRKEELVLKLPGPLRRWASLTVAREFRTRTVVMAALVTGTVVSVVELVCTGQVYLPMIRLMVQFSASRARGLAFLALYNGAFVTPLVVTFLAVYAGTTSDSLTRFLGRHLALAKLCTTFLFLGMGVLLVVFR
jgi:hypothetical protein